MRAAAGIAFEHLLEPAQEPGQPAFAEVPRAQRRLRLLVLVIELGADRMMRVVDLVDQFGDRELQLMRPEPGALFLWREPVPLPEMLQDRGGLADQLPAVHEERRREGRAGGIFGFP